MACHGDHTVVRIDARTGRRIDPAIDVGLSPIGVQAVGRTVLVASADGSVTRIRLPDRPTARAG